MVEEQTNDSANLNCSCCGRGRCCGGAGVCELGAGVGAAGPHQQPAVPPAEGGAHLARAGSRAPALHQSRKNIIKLNIIDFCQKHLQSVQTSRE